MIAAMPPETASSEKFPVRVSSALLLIIRGVVIPHLMRNPGRSISLDSHFRGNDNHQFSCNRALGRPQGFQWICVQSQLCRA